MKLDYPRRCYICEETVYEDENYLYDGDLVLCEQCAHKESNRVFDNLNRIYESEEKVIRMAFAKYGIDDFAFCVDEEMK